VAAWTDALGRRRTQRFDPTAHSRVVVVGAHPDDETLGIGGCLQVLHRRGALMALVVASDGEAAYPTLNTDARRDLGCTRRVELMAALKVQGLAEVPVHWLGLPDSGLAEREPALREAVRRSAPGADLLLAPWSEDGHPDHEVCGRAALEAGAAFGVEVWELPVWAWHWGTGEDLAPRWAHAHRVSLSSEEQQIKADAVSVFVTQVRPLGPALADQAVLPPAVLARFARPLEVVLVTPTGAGA